MINTVPDYGKQFLFNRRIVLFALLSNLDIYDIDKSFVPDLIHFLLLFEASVIIMKDFVKSGYCSNGSTAPHAIG